jgi:hypothetical protein
VRICGYFSKPKEIENKKVLETLVYPVLINKYGKVQSRPDDRVSVVDKKLHADLDMILFGLSEQ